MVVEWGAYRPPHLEWRPGGAGVGAGGAGVGAGGAGGYLSSYLGYIIHITAHFMPSVLVKTDNSEKTSFSKFGEKLNCLVSFDLNHSNQSTIFFYSN